MTADALFKVKTLESSKGGLSDETKDLSLNKVRYSTEHSDGLMDQTDETAAKARINK